MAFIGELLWFIIGDYFVTFVLIGLAIGLIVAGAGHRWRAGTGWRTLLDWFVLFGVGIANLVNFLMHSVFGDFSAKAIGWDQSPFQFELALASLGVGVAAVVAFPRRAGWTAKLVVTVAQAIFSFGAGVGHVYQLVAEGVTAWANAGPILYTDLLWPVWPAVLLVLARREGLRAGRGPEAG